MARVNVTIPDELHARARAAGLNVSRLATAAVADALDRLERVVALDQLLADLAAEEGPPAAEELEAARAWVREITSTAAGARSA